MKTRLGSNYSYYQILIVEDIQPITNMSLQCESLRVILHHKK